LTDIPTLSLDIAINDVSVDFICHRAGKLYRQLAIELGLDFPFIERVVIEKATVVDRTRAFLREWMSRNGSEATLRKVGKAIVEVGMDVSIVHDCCDY